VLGLQPRLSRAILKLLEPMASLRIIDQPEFGRLTQAKFVIVRPASATISTSMLKLARLFVPLLVIAEAI